MIPQQLLCLGIGIVLIQGSFALAHAADAPKKLKLIDFNSLDPKTVSFDKDMTVKLILTRDPVHKKAVDIVGEFPEDAAPGTFIVRGFQKKLPPNTINTKRFSGVRVWYRSDSETVSSLTLQGPARKDGRHTCFVSPGLEGKSDWQEATIEFSEFKSYEEKVWDKASNSQKIFPKGLSPQAEDFDLITTIGVTTGGPRNRGTGVKSHFQIAELALIEK